MNRQNLKSYAPLARRDFIQAIKDRAAFYGLTANKIEPVVEKGDVALIAGREHPRTVANKRKQLEARIKKHGFEQTMEAMAYTWFNRLLAIRFMELHGYLDHGYRVLSHPEGKPTPEILEHAEHVEFPGLKREAVIDMKVAGNKEEELYRLLLSAQCNALQRAMPFLFERIDDETELLLPDNLLHSDSLIRKLVTEIDEEDWQQVEIIGWLYQFYISEKKDEVIGKVVASEDIPAATQLFTPNWIVKYLVQNTLGRQWLATYPQSVLRQQMEYYIEPAEQTPEVQEQLKAITPISLDPEELTLLDPACGSGHILVEAYDLFKAIYQERGHRAKDIPALILQKNLFGLEIDDRAAQLAAFALMMKARADDRRIFDSEAKPNILAFEDSYGMNPDDITQALNSPINKDDVPSEYLFEEIQEEKDGLFSKKALAEKGCVSKGDIASLLELFENAKTLGSLIQIPPKLADTLPAIEMRLDDVLKCGDLTHAPAHDLKPLLRQARRLTAQHGIVLANPPYLGAKGMNPLLKDYVANAYPACKSDLFAIFVIRSFDLLTSNGFSGFVTPYVWMFISSYEDFRTTLLSRATLTSLIQLEYNAFEPACVPVCTLTLRKGLLSAFVADCIRLSEFKGHQNQSPRTLEAIRNPLCGWRFRSTNDQFLQVPGKPICYWIPKAIAETFFKPPIATLCEPREGMTTGRNVKFVRFWFEVDYSAVFYGAKNREEARESGRRWFPYNKGGEFRRWYGNLMHVVDWKNDGDELQTATHPSGRVWAHNFNLDFIFRPALTWSDITSSGFSARYIPPGCLFDATGLSAFFRSLDSLKYGLALCNSVYVSGIASVLNPTMHFKSGDFSKIPIPAVNDMASAALCDEAISLSKADWDSFETSWDFRKLPVLQYKTATLRQSEEAYAAEVMTRFARLRDLEEKNNRNFIEAYGLQDELSPKVSDGQITLSQPDREGDSNRLLSYAVGCIMGRYSLDKPGLVYAQSGNEGFDSDQYKTFEADDDGIIPLLRTDWGIPDDAGNRIVEFVGVAWPKEHLEENLKFIAESLGTTSNEQPRDTIRRYLSTGFYKHHVSMYKKRPIYWLFSSGKQRAFQCLVYLHRYHEGTLARMRTEYVIPLQGQITARIEQLEGDKAKATSTSHRNKLQKEQTDLKKQEDELRIFEEKLKHAADQKIALDLDDGVKANYAKFGDLLAESKTVTGGTDDE
jgi:type II restriction/modification system DNA methylase subunit YeeA